MLGAMQDWDLVVTHLIDHAAREHGGREHVTRWADGSETRTDWAGIRRDALKMVQALRAAGIGKGDRIATLGPSVPMGRGGTVEEVAEAIVWLMSEKASYVTATLFDVSGGR